MPLVDLVCPFCEPRKAGGCSLETSFSLDSPIFLLDDLQALDGTLSLFLIRCCSLFLPGEIGQLRILRTLSVFFQRIDPRAFPDFNCRSEPCRTALPPEVGLHHLAFSCPLEKNIELKPSSDKLLTPRADSPTGSPSSPERSFLAPILVFLKLNCLAAKKFEVVS